MATHGRTGLARMLMGSVGEKIVRLSAIPVVTVKPEEISKNMKDNKCIKKGFHVVA